MATKEKSTKPELEVGEIVSRSEHFIENNKKNILYGVVALAVIVGAILAIRHGYMIPREKEAASIMFKGEQYFARDSFALALNGNKSDFPGFISIADQYGSTKAGNLAKAYAGLSYFKLGENDKALNYLKDYKGNDEMITPAVIGTIGDCYVNMDKIKDGIDYFEKAAKKADNEVVSPVYLKKAGVAYESLGQYADAAKAYTTIKEKYYNSVEASNIDKYIARANALAAK